jgi:ABC-type branched-subunit amino acid transport system ATPase component/branched-subunit amino acid ABC-type transport system permease component
VEEVIRFALLGFGVGALYALASQGLIVIYRGSGVLNFALGAIGMAAAYLWWELHVNHGWAYLPAMIVGVIFAALIGVVTHLFLMRPRRQAAPLVRVIATLGVLITLQSIAVLRYEATPRFVPSTLPTDVLHIHNTIVISADRVYLLGIALVSTVALWALYRYTRFGLGTSAVAENERAAASLGWSPDLVATANWALGCALAAVAAILIVPIVTLQPQVLTNLLIAATAAALVAGFRSFPIAFVAGLVMGIAQTEIQRYVSSPGWGQAVPFIVIVAWLLVRGQALPLRDYLLQRLPTVGSGRLNWGGIAFGVVLGLFLLSVTPAIWIDAFTVTFSIALVLLSIVVLTGYAGQLSLAQYAIAGFGAYIAGRLASAQDFPFLLALVVGVAATIPLGVLFALPAVRTRGINLAIVTLGLGTAVELILFDNQNYTGGQAGTVVKDPTLFGFNINAPGHPMRYGVFALVCLVLATIAVANIRRGRAGRRLIAVRTNERAAAALGINVAGAKLYAFGVSAAIAALGGILIAFRSTAITYTDFTNFTSITSVAFAMIGGIGYLMGPILGGQLAPGAIDSRILDELGTGVGKYIPLIGGVSLIVLVLANQNGIAREAISQIGWVRSKLGGRLPFLRPREREPVRLAEGELEVEVERVVPRTLTVRDLTVRYGGTTAVDTVGLSVTPGKILGLIGPNGAGKTTFIDAVTGFTRRADGTITLDEREVADWSPVKRARAGMGRSFQSLELFEDSTVLDNLRAASDPRDGLSYVRDVVRPINPPLPAEVVSAIREFRLEDDLERNVEDLPYGQRRLLAIARAVATHPSILLLDEPAAGLGDVESAELAHLVRRLADDWGIGVLLVEHDMNFVMSVCDELVVLDFGRKIAEGPPDTVRNNPAVIAAYLGEEEPEAGGQVPPSGAVPAEPAGQEEVKR